MNRFRHHHPTIRRLFAEMQARNIGPAELAQRSGVHLTTIYGWRRRRDASPPLIQNIEACLNVVGYRLEITPDGKGTNG